MWRLNMRENASSESGQRWRACRIDRGGAHRSAPTITPARRYFAGARDERGEALEDQRDMPARRARLSTVHLAGLGVDQRSALPDRGSQRANPSRAGSTRSSGAAGRRAHPSGATPSPRCRPLRVERRSILGSSNHSTTGVVPRAACDRRQRGNVARPRDQAEAAAQIDVARRGLRAQRAPGRGSPRPASVASTAIAHRALAVRENGSTAGAALAGRSVAQPAPRHRRGAPHAHRVMRTARAVNRRG
jgi:hypothetical protein